LLFLQSFLTLLTWTREVPFLSPFLVGSALFTDSDENRLEVAASSDACDELGSART
jgi:hypothetical protein